MRTWKQGVIGTIHIPDSKGLYIKCLKYPLATWYDQFDLKTLTFGKELFKAFLDLSMLKLIERIGTAPLTADEKMIGGQFTVHHRAGTTEIESIGFNSEAMPLMLLHRGKPCSMADIQERYSTRLSSRRI